MRMCIYANDNIRIPTYHDGKNVQLVVVQKTSSIVITRYQDRSCSRSSPGTQLVLMPEEDQFCRKAPKSIAQAGSFKLL